MSESGPEQQDKYLWLEEIDSEKALDWVRSQNASTFDTFANSEDFERRKALLLSIYQSDERIPYADWHSGYLYNFWKDQTNERGLFRRTSLDSYLTDDPDWETVLDLDALSEAESENWVISGINILRPNSKRALVELSRGGSDASVVREFDLQSKCFIENGFKLPEAKSRVTWIDQDTLFVATDFGEGSLSQSGYPRIVKRWKRGTPLDSAEQIHEAPVEAMSAGAICDLRPGFERQFVYHKLSFFTQTTWQIRNGAKVLIDIPEDALHSHFKSDMLVTLRSDWMPDGINYPAGSLLIIDYERFIAGMRDFYLLFKPTPKRVLQHWFTTQSQLVLEVLDNVQTTLEIHCKVGSEWTVEHIANPQGNSQHARPFDAFNSDDLWLIENGYLTPATLKLKKSSASFKTLAQEPHWFDNANMQISWHDAVSLDGTSIPFARISQKNKAQKSSSPTILYGYGGFEVSLTPSYSGTIGAGWLIEGGSYVVANIRGGGEFGPDWHKAALRENRHRAYEDFAAVAETLVEQGLCTPQNLGIMGGSNGGLLVGNMLTQFPQLFSAAVCMVPLLDMRRYTKLLAGASWQEEYGDPDDPEQWAYLKTYSPYHNIDPDASYPPMLLTTSTRDDRVHPGHARKMAFALGETGHPVHYYENIEGGHGGAADAKQLATLQALIQSFFKTYLMN